MCFIFLYKTFSGNFIVLRRIQRDAIFTVHRYPRKVPVFIVGFLYNLDFLDRFLTNLKCEIS